MKLALRALLGSLKARIANRSDTEYEQALLRLFIGTFILLYLQAGAAKHAAEWMYGSGAYLVVMGLFMLGSIIVLGCIFVWPQPSPVRRVVANALDVLAITYIMLYGGEHTTPMFGLFLWITFGCGFRFGARYLVISLALCGAGFSIVLGESSYWHDKHTLGIGLLIGMVALSLYVLVLISRLYDALERAAAANQAKRVFVSSVSHELRTPLNAIIGMNDLLSATKLSPEQGDMVHSMHDASRVMLSLIEGVLDFSKIEAGKLTLETVDFDLHALLRSTMAIFAQQVEMKGLKLGLLIMPDVTSALNGDARHVQQILLNLIGNAVKFTEKGEVRLTVSVLTESAQSVRLRFAVRDTGIGIAPADQQRIFESFEQVESPGMAKHRGTGLGTTIAKQLAELMGGAMGLESAPAAGSTFWFDVPFTKQDIADPENVTNFRDARILLIGFPAQARQLLTAGLRQWDMDFTNADTLDTAMARLSEAVALKRPYRLGLVYAENTTVDIGRIAADLRARDGKSLSLLLCTPRIAAAVWTTRMPAEFASVIALPPEKRLLYNALHSVLAGQEPSNGVISLADYYRSRKGPAKSYSILVADDDQINRKVIAKQLEMAGHEVKLVADGEQALDAIDEAAADYDVVILDSNMPVMNGIEATRMIRITQAGRHGTPIIMFSADATPETISEATAAGVDVFLPKPIEAAKLFAAIENLTEKYSQELAKSVQALAPPQPAQSELLNADALHELEHMSQDPNFVHQLVDLFNADSTKLAAKLDDAISGRRYDEFKAHVHALKGSAINLGAERLFAHCTKIGALNFRELAANSGPTMAETHSIIEQTQAVLLDYVKSRNTAHS